MSLRIKGLSERLADQSRSELQQALIRLVVGSAVLGYLTLDQLLRPGATTFEQTPFWWGMGLFFVATLGIITAIVLHPGISWPRRLLGMLVDISGISYCMHLAGDVGAPLLAVYLWVIFGNGFRFGIRSLWLCTGLAVTGFGIASFFTPYWQQHPILWGATLVCLIVLPGYAATLIRQLNDARHRAEEASSAKSRFLANMSHEMRTPLNGIVGMTELLSKTPLQREQRDFVESLHASSRALTALISELLDFAKIEAGRLNVEHIGFDLIPLIRDIEHIIRPLAERKQLQFLVSLPADVPHRLQGDPLHLHQVLINLLGNAVKFTETGRVELRIQCLGEQPDRVDVRFDVIDTGIGISQQAQRCIFEAFVQADDSITRRHGGTGLGTAIAKQLVELMGGTITLHSVPGQGSTFSVCLPLEKQPESTLSISGGDALSGQRALLLCRDEDLAAHVQAKLRGWGARVERVASTPQAYNAVLTAARVGTSFQVLIATAADLGMAARQFATTLHRESALHDLHLILLDAAIENHERMALIDHGFADVIADPHDSLPLFNALHGLNADPSPANVTRLSDHYRVQRPGSGPRVLIVEDNPTNRKVIEAVLRQGGYRVTLAEYGEQALGILEEQVFELVIVDMQMPDLSGIDVFRQYRFMAPQEKSPFMMLTANATVEARQICEEAGIHRFLTKPIQPKVLLDAVRQLTAGADGAESDDGAHRDPVGTAPAVLNEDMLEELIQLDSGDDFVADLVGGFLDDSALLLTEISEALASRDRTLVREKAHALKGCAASVGAEALSLAAGRMMSMKTETLDTEGEQHLAALHDQFTQTATMLKAYLSRARRESSI